MSTNEPPAGTPSNGAPEYGQPQDPWAGGFDYTPGAASVPTDNIPSQYEPYGTYEQYGNSDPWAQPTAPQQGAPGQQPWAPPPTPPSSKVVPIVILVAVLFVLVGGGGAVAYYLSTKKDDTITTNPTPSAKVTSAAPRTTEAAATTGPPVFDPADVKIDDCLVNRGTDKKPRMEIVGCTKGAYQVIKVVSGNDVKQDDDGDISDEEAWTNCAGTRYTNFYKNNFEDDELDVIYCMVKVK